MDAGALVDRVTAILQEVAAEVVEPRFANPADADMDEKAPNEMVTTADTQAEALLCRRLGELLPGVPVVPPATPWAPSGSYGPGTGATSRSWAARRWPPSSSPTTWSTSTA